MGLRLNLLVDNPGDIRPGFVNIDPLAPEPDPLGRVRCDPSDLSPIADAGEVVELVAHDILDRVPMHRAGDLLDHWLSRLSRDGTITVSCVDLLEVTKSLQNRLITIENANRLLHGEQDKDWKFRQANYTLGQLADTLQGKGMRVQQKRVNEFRALVTARRP